MHSRSGFTLIEMLVVIAMIGLLSAVVLVALGPSRNKAKDTRIITNINQIQALAMTYYDPATGYFNDNAIRTAAAAALQDIKNQNGIGGSVYPGCHSYSNDVAVFAKLTSTATTTYYCADTMGNAMQLSAPISGGCGRCDSINCIACN